jgi:asparagine synthase (glutamine-hydrolysing)
VATINGLLSGSDRAAGAVGATQQTFSAVFPGESNDEERYVDAVAAGCGPALRVHKVRPSADRFLVDLRDFVRTQEEPVISTGPYAQYCVMREASRHVTVMVDGQGADEMLAGYLPYHLVHLRSLSGTRAALELGRSGDVLWRLGRARIADAVHRRRSTPVAPLLAAEFRAAHAGEDFPVVRDDLKARLAEDLFRHSLPALLRYEDRNTMRFSLEGRVPFLDTRLLKLLWSLDESAIVHKGCNKRALRDATVDLLPALVHSRRNKIGFTTPEDTWLRRIKNEVYLIFSSASFGARPYFDQAAVLRALQGYLSGRSAADTMALWRLLNVELWLREFIDAPSPSAVESAVDDDEPDERTGVHPQAPAKPDHQPNPDKTLVLAGGGWARFPLRIDLITPGDDLPAVAAARTAAFFAGLPTLPAPARTVAEAGRWYLFVSEKVVAVAQGRVYPVDEVHCGLLAKTLSRFVTRTPYGIGLGHPATMQLAIREVGLPRILLASAAGAAGKAVGRRGWFYWVAGPAARAIDGPTEYSAYPANVSAKLAPADPAGMARRISAAVRAALAPHGVLAAQGDGAPVTAAAALFGGTVVIDANDLGQDILGHDTERPDAELVAAFADNPLGQAREQTPFAVVVAQWPDAGRLHRVPRQGRGGPRVAPHRAGTAAPWRRGRTGEPLPRRGAA